MTEKLPLIIDVEACLSDWADKLTREDAIVGDRVTLEQLVGLNECGRLVTLTDVDGSIMAGGCIFPTQNEEVQEIGAVCVAREYRGKGLLAGIVDRIIEVTEDNSWTTIVVTDNQAVANAFFRCSYGEEDPGLILSFAYPKETKFPKLDEYNDELIAERQERITHKDAVVLADRVLSDAINGLS